MLTGETDDLVGRMVIDSDGEKIGDVSTVYVDSTGSGRPGWVGVTTGLLGRQETLVPLGVLKEAAAGALLAPFDVKAVAKAPHGNPGETLTAEQERELFDFYGLPYTSGEAGQPVHTGGALKADAPAQELGVDKGPGRLDDALTRVLRGPDDLPTPGEQVT